MNKVRITGVILLLTGISMIIFLENEKFDILSGLLLGVGLGFTITGKFNRRKSLSKN